MARTVELQIAVDPSPALRALHRIDATLHRARPIGDLIRGARHLRHEAATLSPLRPRRWLLAWAANRCTDFARELAERDLAAGAENLERTADAGPGAPHLPGEPNGNTGISPLSGGRSKTSRGGRR